MRRTITFTAKSKPAGSLARPSLRRLPRSICVQQRGVKLFAAAPEPYKVDWEHGPQGWHAWHRVIAETWYNFKQNVNKMAEINRLYYPVNKSIMLSWGQEEIEKVTPLSSLGRELFIGMNNWIQNLRHLAWGRIDDPEYLDNFALFKSFYMQCKSEAQAMANDEQFKASWADWIEHCKSVSKTVYEDYINESEWRHEVDLHEQTLKMQLAEAAHNGNKDDAASAYPMTQVWHNPLEEGWSFHRQVLPRFPKSKFNKLVPYDVQILDPLFVKIETLHNMSLQVDQLSNILNDMGIKYQNTFATATSSESANVLGIVEAYQAMVADVESGMQQGIWNAEEVKFLEQKLFHEVLQEVDNLSQKGALPSLKLRYPDIFR